MRFKKTILILSSGITTLPVVISASCNNNNNSSEKTPEQDKNIKSNILNQKISEFEKYVETFREIDDENINTLCLAASKNIEKFKSKSVAGTLTEKDIETEFNKFKKDAINACVSNNVKLDETNQKLENLVKEIKELSDKYLGEKVKTNSDRAVDFLKVVSTFITNDLVNAMKTQAPKKYAEQLSLINKIEIGIKDTIKSFENTPETFEHFFDYENSILFTIRRSNLLLEFFDDSSNPIVVPTEKNEYMDKLFDWRINDLQRAIDETNSKSDFSGKSEIINTLTVAKEKYVEAKNKSLLFVHQLVNFARLEKEGGIIWTVLNPNSRWQHGFLNNLQLGKTFTVSNFPVFKKITDTKFLDEIRNKIVAVLTNLDNFNKLEGVHYLNSLYFQKTRDLFEENAKYLKTLLSNDYIAYIGFDHKKELDAYITKLESLYNEIVSKVINVKSNEIKEKMDKEVNDGLENNGTNNLRKFFNDNIATQDHNDNEKDKYFYFYNNYNSKLNTVKLMPTDSFNKSFDRYVQYKLIDEEIRTTYELLELWKLLDEDPASGELNKLLNPDKSAEKYTKQIKQKEDQNVEFKKIIEDAKLLIDSSFDKYSGSSDEEIKTWITQMLNKSNEMHKTFADKFKDKKDDEGEWLTIFGDEPREIIIKAEKEYNDLVKSISQTMASESSAKLNENVESIESKFSTIKYLFVTPKKLSIFGELHSQFESYDFESDDYPKQLEFIEAKKEELKNIIGDLPYKNAIEKSVLKADLLNKQTLIKQYIKDINEKKGNLFYWIKEYKGFKTFEKVFTDLESLIDAAVTTVDSDDLQTLNEKMKNICEKASEFKKSFGTRDDLKNKPVLSGVESLISENDSNIESFKRKIEKIKKLALVAPGQEIYALIRFMEKDFLDFSKIMINDSSKDEYLIKIIKLEFEKIKKEAHFRDIIDFTPSTDSFDLDENNKKYTHKTFYEEFRKLEDDYAKSLLKFLKAKENNSSNLTSIKEELKITREAFYNFLNKKKENGITNFSNKYIEFSAANYDITGYPHYTPYDLANSYAKAKAIIDVMTWLHEEYLK
ncbi:hypothetical protein [Mycoplasma sp. Mirounga ES2805-ORL]|uniref:hypothetical protein n=1 Tax=Mycoplasma sp. Mirounga ES2805-ORL TaxID=754514 RepID=UPI00197B203F|nr:hypothetical protein [Mycoplasma sp. Mirounga ES2805-ORL]QSF13724.1 hypothetical protein JXZ90_00265 [Mycoplasma sp. Mirounga ES2805-ORL]